MRCRRSCGAVQAMLVLAIVVLASVVPGGVTGMAAEDAWPEFPRRDATVEIPAQEWPLGPGERRISLQIRFPQGALEHVTSQTGIMLTLHNWGGADCAGTASPESLAARLNVVAICVNYLQSGRQASLDDPRPYDCGYLQALDALRALWFARQGLLKSQRPFDDGRLFATGGSGGGNVALMANKLAPRTFACIVDICGMNKLSADIAFGLPGGSDLNARWSRDPAHPYYLSPDEQDVRFVGHPGHLATMQQLGTKARILVVHGVDDTTCPFAEARDMVASMKQAGLDVESHFVTKEMVDGRPFTGTGHALGDRTAIVFHVAEKYLQAGPEAGPGSSLRRAGPCDFDCRDERVQYRTPRGRFVISYAQGYPVGRFEPDPAPPHYESPADLSYFLDDQQHPHPIRSVADWNVRRRHLLARFQQVAGELPGASLRAPLAMQVLAESRTATVLRRKVSYQSDPFDRVSAWLLMPAPARSQKSPAVLCLHQTFAGGKDEPAGVAGSANMRYALELAERGYITLSPDYPSLGEHTYDFTRHPEFASGTMKAIWDNLRGVELLSELPEVDAERIGVIGHSLGGHNAIFTALWEPRLSVVVSSCGFTSFARDDLPSWTGPRYMPRITARAGADAARMPFEFAELIAALAPRPFLACAAVQDDDFDVQGVRDVVTAARAVYALHKVTDHLQAYYADGPHDFPPAARQRAYEFLDAHLRRSE